MPPVCLLIGCSPSAYFHYWTANQWVTACLEVMGAFVVLAVALLGVYAHHEVRNVRLPFVFMLSPHSKPLDLSFQACIPESSNLHSPWGWGVAPKC